MNIKPIKNETDYTNALMRLEKLFDAPLGSPESDEADVLAILVDEYETKLHGIDAPDPIEAIKIRMEEMHLNQNDLISEIGDKKQVADILNRKRELTLQMIRNLTTRLNISSDVLIRNYQLAK